MAWKMFLRKPRQRPFRFPEVVPGFRNDHLLRDAGFVRDRVRPDLRDPYLAGQGGWTR